MATRGRILSRVAIAAALAFVLLAPAHISKAGDGGSPWRDTNYLGECWDPAGGLWAARYEATNYRYVDGSSTTHYFPTVYTIESWVCDGDIPNSSGYSNDGWRMVVTNYYNITVYNASNQQVYP
jgi:hypothetical protein